MKGSMYGKIIKSRYFFRSFCVCFAIMAAVLSGVLAYIYTENENVLHDTFIKNNEQSLAIAAKNIDQNVLRASYLINSIDNNALSQSFFLYGSAGNRLFTNQELRIKEFFSTIETSNEFIDSVFLYSEKYKSVFGSQGLCLLESYTDDNWVDSVKSMGETQGIVHINRAKDNKYPFVTSSIKLEYNDGELSAIIININLSKLYSYKDMPGKFFVISDSGKIISRDGQREAEEPIDSVDELKEFYDEHRIGSNVLKRNKDNVMCVYSSCESDINGWSYVLISPIEQYDAAMMRNRIMIIIVGIIFAFLVAAIAFMLTARSYKPIDDIMDVLNRNSQTNRFNDSDRDEIKYITSVIVENMQFNKSLSDELRRKLDELTEAKIDALKFQINPHFMFNTLNMIRYMEIVNLGYDHYIPEMTFKLCEILRYALEGEDIVSVKDEIDYVYKYVDILNMRYENRIILHVITDQKSESARIPKLIIQPIVENSVIHGMKDGIMNITITSKCVPEGESSYIILSIEDDGIGIDEDKLKKIKEHTSKGYREGIGLSNIIKRIKLIYADKAEFNIYSDKGTKVVIKIPYVK